MTRTDEVASVEAPMHEIINFFSCKKNPDFNIFLNMISLHNATLTYPNSPLLISWSYSSSQLNYLKFRSFKDKSQINNDIFSEWRHKPHIQLLQSCTAWGLAYLRLHRRLFTLSHCRGFRWLPQAPAELYPGRWPARHFIAKATKCKASLTCMTCKPPALTL